MYKHYSNNLSITTEYLVFITCFNQPGHLWENISHINIYKNKLISFHIKYNNLYEYVIGISFQVLHIAAVLKFCLVLFQGYFMLRTLLWYLLLLTF